MKTASILWAALLAFSCWLQTSLQAPTVRHELHSTEHHHKEDTYPSLVDSLGNHLSYDLSTPSIQRQRRSLNNNQELRTYFKVDAFGSTIYLNVTLNNEFLYDSKGNGPIVEYMYPNGTSRTTGSQHRDCFHLGQVHLMKESVSGEEVIGDSNQWVSISNCHIGVHGVIATSSGYIFIEPVMSDDVTHSEAPRRHVVYKNKRSKSPGSSVCPLEGSSGEQSLEKTVSSTIDKVISDKMRLKRSSSSEYVIEAAIVADKSMLDYHGRENLEAYLFTLMCVVHHLYKDSTIGQPVIVSLVKTIILEDEPEGFSRTNIARTILHDFCSWQRNHRETSRGPHYDVAVMVTRKEICEANGVNCGTLGMADISSACDPQKSCNLNKDTGLSTSFTIAHELGHNLGVRHDGDPQVHCSPNPRYLMAPSFAESQNPHYWSSCSRKQLQDQLSNHERSFCLLNRPGNSPPEFSGSPILHGMEYSPTEQCQLQAGDNTTVHCPDMPDECQYLWCQAEGSTKCTHQNSPPASGTPCTLSSGEGVCYRGECEEYSKVIEPRDGVWGVWGEWSVCSLTCGTGVQYSTRECDSPVPANGGQWCVGQRKRYRTCNTQLCPSSDDFRSVMCQQNPPNTDYSSWKSASLARILFLNLEMCRSHCIPSTRDLIYSIMYYLPDGAPCLTDQSKGVCVHGKCESVGCDHIFGEKSVTDECGVWCGDGSSCLRVSRVFNNVSLPGDYYYYEAMNIPEGSANILIEEVTPSSSNFIAVDGSKTQGLNLNNVVKRGGISRFFFADSSWTYGRQGNSKEYFQTDGPINENVTVYLIANSLHDGIRVTYSLPNSKIDTLHKPVYFWKSDNWGTCEAECAWGVQNRTVHCVRIGADKTEEYVDSNFCDPSLRPETNQSCYTEDCIYNWTVTHWDSCNATCGEGHQSRMISCVWTKRNGDTQTVDDNNCDIDGKPDAVQKCRVVCVYIWSVTVWDDCDVICGEGTQRRSVICEWEKDDGSTERVNDTFCGDEAKPDDSQICVLEDCVYIWVVAEWSNCDAECGHGEQQRTVRCEWDKGDKGTEVVRDSFCSEDLKPTTVQSCHLEDCVYEWTHTDWKECEVSVCGAGQQVRTVTCEWVKKDESTEIVNNHFCTNASKPTSNQNCQVECIYRWEAHGWDSCSGLCEEGEQNRQVSCEWVKTNQVTETISDAHCDSDSKPVSSQKCRLSDCKYIWKTREWGECDVECGEGWKRRDVVCLWEDLLKSDGHTESEAIVSSENCPQDVKPEDLTVCRSPQRCPEWFISEWSECSGCGAEASQSRLVECRDANDHQVPSSLCLDQRPVNTQSCVRECPTEPPCEDTVNYCSNIVTHNFCQSIEIFRTMYCCLSCSRT